MVTETTNALDPLLPDRHPQHDLFICDVADAVLKDVMAHMEHPFYSLSKKPETAVRRYEHNGKWLEITPSVKGLATIYDLEWGHAGGCRNDVGMGEEHDLEGRSAYRQIELYNLPKKYLADQESDAGD